MVHYLFEVTFKPAGQRKRTCGLVAVSKEKATELINTWIDTEVFEITETDNEPYSSFEYDNLKKLYKVPVAILIKDLSKLYRIAYSYDGYYYDKSGRKVNRIDGINGDYEAQKFFILDTDFSDTVFFQKVIPVLFGNSTTGCFIRFLVVFTIIAFIVINWLSNLFS